MKTTIETGTLVHRETGNRTSVKIRHLYADNWEAYYAGKWRAVHIRFPGWCFIRVAKDRIAIEIDGVTGNHA